MSENATATPIAPVEVIVPDDIGGATDMEAAFNKHMGWDKGTGVQKAGDTKPAPEPVKPKDEPKKEEAKIDPPKPETKPEAKTPDLENPAGLSPTASQKFN